jgi:predicted ABC-type ATPase
MKEIFVIAGPNGAGKTTAAFTLLPDFIGVDEYINADSIAYGLSPFNPEAVAIQAGKLMLERIHTVLNQNKNLAFETTLASKTFVKLLQDSRAKGYKINIIFLWLHSVELAINRVKLRVEQGGHSIPEETIKRRYERGLLNLFNLYMPLADCWWLHDNSGANLEIISGKLQNKPIEIINFERWNILQHKYFQGK